MNIDTLLEGMRTERRGTLLFYGPPGTGKSALARQLAYLTERPLRVHRPSDLESPWVGVTEQNIARAFEAATEDGSLLLLDEAESFLGERRDSRARWEVSQTNEMLTQIERFDGLLVCTTNLLVRLDPAALRRFDVKVAFDYLRPDQVRALFIATLESSDVHIGDEHVLAHLDRLHRLTAGDFAAATRRFRRLRLPMSPQALLEAITAELSVRADGAVGRIGF
jgi:transitional endoplasmic reticulum ATPase